MAKKITDLRTTSKTETTSRQYLLVSDITSRESTKIALNDVFPALQSGKETGTVSAGTAGNIQDLFVGGGVGSTASNTNKSTLIFKGLKAEVATSGSQSAALEIRTDTSTSDPNKRNLVMALNVHKLNLSDADNTDAEFLSEPGGSNPLNLSSGGTQFTGVLDTNYGGTGLTNSDAQIGGLITWESSTSLGTITFRNKGSLLVGQLNAAPIELTVGSGNNGKFLKQDSTTGSGLAWADPTFTGGTLTSDLTLSGADIIMGTNYISGSGGANQGLRFHNTNDNVYIGTGTFYSTGRLNVDGNIHLGNSTGTSAVEIKAKSTTTGASPAMTVQGANASGTGAAAGNLTITAGVGEDSNSDGGALYLKGGEKDGSGTAGDIYMQTDGGTAVLIDENRDVNIKSGSLVIDTATEGIVHKGSTTVAQATDWTTGVTTNGTSGVITLESTTTLGTHGEAEFQVTNSAVQADSLIFLQMMNFTGAAAQMIGCYVSARASGSFNITVFNPKSSGGSTTAGDIRIAFLVVNNSV